MIKQTLLSTVITFAAVLAVIYFFPWDNVNWGTVSMRPSEVITVTGYAESQEGNQQSSFTAGVSAVGDDKQVTIDEVNKKVADIVEKVKAFGIVDTDIKTQNISIYQNQEPYTSEGGVSKSRLGQWNVSNNVEIILRDVARVDEFSTLLASTGANNVWGPNFTTGDSREAQKALLAGAIENAKSKAEEAAKATGKKLGKVLSITEAGADSGYPMSMYDRGMGGGGGFPTQPGTTTVSQIVTVTFELR